MAPVTVPLALADIGVDELAGAQQLALIRLHAKLTGETHRLLLDFSARVRAEMVRVAGEDGTLGPLNFFNLEQYGREQWAETFNNWEELLGAARRQAAWIPFGQVARLHGHFMGAALAGLEEGALLEQGGLAVGVGMPDSAVLQEFAPVIEAMSRRIDALLNNSAALAYSDGKSLSGRIWDLSSQGWAGITNILRETAITGDSAWNAAKKLEGYLGAGQECPRWTSTRLYQLTKTDIAQGDERGLIRGNPCESRGVAYSALRLARNEIQIVHHMATDEAFANMPWVEQEQVILSPDHPPITCECPDVAAGGEKGDGVYPKGEVVLPLHVQCVPDGQRVRTLAGDKLIEDVRIGDRVLTHEGRYRRVMRAYLRPFRGDVVRITTKSGRVIVVTPEHPLLAGGTWKAACDLVVGDALCVPPTPPAKAG